MIAALTATGPKAKGDSTSSNTSTLVLVAEEDQNVGSGCPQFVLVIKNETVKSKQVTEQGA